MSNRVVTYYLEMTAPSQLSPAPPRDDLQLIRCEHPSPEFHRFLYAQVGAAWRWIDRLEWSDERWLAYLDRPEQQTWFGLVGGAPAGYFELEAQPGGSVEIAYFGLLPRFIGRGYGGALLTSAVERAWDMGARRVWVHTCTLDHPSALANYRRRGFRLYKEETSAGPG